jgi:hypothetical protein
MYKVLYLYSSHAVVRAITESTAPGIQYVAYI